MDKLAPLESMDPQIFTDPTKTLSNKNDLGDKILAIKFSGDFF